VLRRKD